MYYIQQVQAPVARYVRTFENKANDSCERIAGGTNQYRYVDLPNCLTEISNSFVEMQNSRGSLSSININRQPIVTIVGTSGTEIG